MEILLIWGSTIIASIGMETVYELKVFKDLADSGFKIDIGKLNSNTIGSNKKFNFSLLSNLIPFYNVLMILFKVATYNKEYNFRNLDLVGAIVPLSEDEYIKYQEKPTGFNAYLLSMKIEDEIKDAFRLTTFEGDNQGDIYFKLDNEKTEIDIVKLTGIAKTFSIERQNAEVIKHLLIHKTIGDEKFINYDIDKFNNKYNDIDVTIKEEYSFENLKKELEEFRNFLVDNETKKEEYQYKKKK